MCRSSKATPWSRVGWAGSPSMRRGQLLYPCGPPRGARSPASSAQQMRDIAARIWTQDGVDAAGSSTALYEQSRRSRIPEFARGHHVRAVNDWAREWPAKFRHGHFILMLLRCPAPPPIRRPRRSCGSPPGGLPTGIIMRLGLRPQAGDAPDVGAGLGRRRRDRDAGINPARRHPSGGSRQIRGRGRGLEPRNQALMRVANFPMRRGDGRN